MGRDSYLEGEMRKRWHPHFLSNEESAPRQQASPRAAVDAPNDLAASMQKEIENLKKRTEDHLKVPQIQTKSPYRKTRTFLMFLGMLFLAFIFFAVGFMVCFSLFPPHAVPSQVSADASASGSSGQASYMVRQGIISGASGSQPKSGMLSQIEGQSAIAAQRRSQEAIATTTDSINSKLRNMLGYRVESVLEPVTKGVASFLINQVGDPRVTGMSYNNQLGRGATNSQQQFQQLQQQQQQQAVPGQQNQPRDVQNQMTAPALALSQQGVAPTGSSTSPGMSGHGVPAQAPSGEGSAANPGMHASEHPAAAQGPLHPGSASSMTNPHAATPSKAAVSQPGLYAVEVSTFDQSQDAYVMMKEMKDSGYDAYIVRTVNGSKLIYHVRFGDFKTYHQARDAAGGYRSLWSLPARVAITSPEDDKMRFR